VVDVPDTEVHHDDPRLAFVFAEAMRGLVQQRDAVESLRGRAGTLIFAASFASSLLGSRALADGLDPWDVAALALLLAIGVLAAAMLWPYYDLTFRLDPEDLVREFVDGTRASSMSEIYRMLTPRINGFRRTNGRIVRRLREALQAALILLILNMLAWMISIAGA
jgi:hypothetical protein